MSEPLHSLIYERFIQTEVKLYPAWLQDMFLANSSERMDSSMVPFENYIEYEHTNYVYLQDKYTKFCETQYHLYINHGEMHIVIDLYDD